MGGGPEKWQKQGRAKRVLSRFCHVVRKSRGHFVLAPLSLNCFGRFSLNSTLFYSQSMSDQFSDHVRLVIHFTLRHVFQICVQAIL